MYQNLYELLNTYIFNGSVVATEYTDLVCTLIASIGSIFLVALPFCVVWRIIKVWF